MYEGCNDFDYYDDDRARTLIERGDMGYRPGEKYPSDIGNGINAKIWHAAMGRTKREYEENLRRELEARYPEIYPCKRGAKSKQGKHRNPFYNSGDESHITKEQFIDAHDGVYFANGYGVALSVHVIIHWELLGLQDHSEAARALYEGFLRPLHAWYDYNHWEHPEKFGIKYEDCHPLFWIYVHECSKKSGFHTHILISIPVEMRKEFRLWVKKRVIQLSKTQPTPKEAVKVVAPPSDPIERQWIFFQYLCKGLDPKATIEIPGYPRPVLLTDLIQFQYCNPGQITCKNRIGLSRNLSRTEREKKGFQSLMGAGIFDKRELYSEKPYDKWHRINNLKNLGI
jgi:hypothetical protein